VVEAAQGITCLEAAVLLFSKAPPHRHRAGGSPTPLKRKNQHHTDTRRRKQRGARHAACSSCRQPEDPGPNNLRPRAHIPVLFLQ
jgi:hypothetical protein